MSDFLLPYELQHARLLCPSLSPIVCSNSCPLNHWCHPINSSCHPISSYPQSFPASGSFPMSRKWVVAILHIRYPKYWSFNFSISPSNGYSGLISFRIDWFYLPLCPRESQESSLVLQFESISSLALGLWHLWSSSHTHTCLLEKP